MVFSGMVPRYFYCEYPCFSLQTKVCSLPIVEQFPLVKRFLMHPAGPFTIHFWAPTCKWGISLANILDISRPVENMSIPQQCAVSLTGVLWSYYSMVIIPKNWNLFSVNVAMGATGLYQLYRVCKYKLALRKQPKLISTEPIAEKVAETAAVPATATVPKVEKAK